MASYRDHFINLTIRRTIEKQTKMLGNISDANIERKEKLGRILVMKLPIPNDQMAQNGSNNV